jgi:phosphatidylglycerol:prolipoprotein diacylglycerol transferase
MLPVLLDLHFVKIYTFGVFLVLAFFWSTFILWKNIRLTSYKEEDIFDGIFIALFGGLFLGRLIYVTLHFNKFGFDFLKFILINGYPGITLYGVLLGSIVTFILFCQIKRIKFSEVVDYIVPSLFLAVGIGKLGSFFAGTEVGTKTKFFLALKYVNFDGFRHLTPLYEAVIFFIAGFISYKFLFAIRREKLWHGITFYFFCWVFSIVYFAFDPLKSNKTLVMGQSVNWAVSLSLLLTFTLYFLYHLRSQIMKGIPKITNSIKPNGKHTHTKVYPKPTEEAGARSSQDSSTN